MAFKQFNQYVEDKNGMFFTLTNDQDSADVIFLYKGMQDVLIADVHYLKTSSYSGYVHCCGKGCPACNYKKGSIKKEDKLFIPLYNLSKRKLEFWDRGPKFLQQVLEPSVFKNYPNPSDYVFRIIRNGVAGDRNTRYRVVVAGRNNSYSYENIIADNKLNFPDSYSLICREMTIEEMDSALNSENPAEIEDYGFIPVPRGTSDSIPEMPTIDIPTPVYSAPPTDIPGVPPIPEEPEPVSIADNDELGAYVPGAPLPEIASDDTTDPLDDVTF